MPVNLNSETSVPWAVSYNEVKQAVGPMASISATGSDNPIFPDGDAQTVIDDWITIETSQLFIDSGRTQTDISTTDDIHIAEKAIIYGVKILVLERAINVRYDSRESTLSLAEMIRWLRSERVKLVNKLQNMSSTNDYQDVKESWST
jgi:hypothetical protein